MNLKKKRISKLVSIAIGCLLVLGATLILKQTIFANPGRATHLVISEVCVATTGASIEFIELYNPTDSNISIDGTNFKIKLLQGSTATTLTLKTVTWNKNIVPAHGFFLFGVPVATFTPTPDAGWATATLTGSSGVVITDASDVVIDRVGWGAITAAGVTLAVEGTKISNTLATGDSIERKAISTSNATNLVSGGTDETKGNSEDTDVNSTDFVVHTPNIYNPQNSSSTREDPVTKLLYKTAEQTFAVNVVSGPFSIWSVDEGSISCPLYTGAATINLSSTSGSGRFDTSAGGAFDGSITSTTIAYSAYEGVFYYKEPTTAGTYSITSAEESPGTYSRYWTDATQTVTISSANTAPTVAFTTGSPPAQRTDGSGTVDISMDVYDADANNCKVRVYYGASSPPTGDPTLLTTGVTATITPVPDVNNTAIYQVGTTTSILTTGPATNTVTFDWDSKTDLPTGNGTYYLKLLANDGTIDCTTPPTTSLTIDNVAPTAPSGATIVSGTGWNTNYIADANKTAVKVSGTKSTDTVKIMIEIDDEDTFASAKTTTLTGLGAVTTYADATGINVTTATALVDGTIAIRITAYDAAGNTSTQTVLKTAATFNKDTVAPTAPSGATIVSGATWNTNYIASGNQTAVKVSGTKSTDTVTIKIEIDDEDTFASAKTTTLTGLAAVTTYADATGIDVTTVTALVDGTIAIRITAYDAAGNTSTQTVLKAAATFNKDTVAPTAPTGVSFTPVDGTVVANTLNSTNTNFTASATITAGQATGGSAELLKGGSSFTTPILDSSIAALDTTVSFNPGFTLTSQVQAAFASTAVVSVKLTDAAGNSSTSSVANPAITVDYVAPTAPVISSIAGDNYINNSEKAAIIVAGTAEADATINVTLSNGANSVSGSGTATAGSYSITLNGTLATPAALADGTITPSVTATDAAGNVSSATATPTATQDTVAPTAPTGVSFTPVDGTVVANTLNSTNTNFTASATITAGQATGGSAELLKGGSSFTTPILDSSIAALDTTVSFNPGFTLTSQVQAAFASGATVSVKLTDAAGNSSTSSVANPTITVDYVAPAAVNNLACTTGSASGKVDLTWTAPGDDGSTGTATSYDVRYSTNTIVESGAVAGETNWADATLATGEPTPSVVAGTAQTMPITGLTSGTTYYFALKTKDEAPNESAISNIPSCVAPVSTTQVIINEVQWDGDTGYHYIELYNKNTGSAADIANWTIYGAGTTTSSITLPAGATISACGYYLIEDLETTTAATSNHVITLTLTDDPGELLKLQNSGGTVIDSANATATTWFAGRDGNYIAMERVSATTSGTIAYNWQNAIVRINLANNVVTTAAGTPGAANTDISSFASNRKIVINEIMWENGVTYPSEYIELRNTDPNNDYVISGWHLRVGTDAASLTDGEDIEWGPPSMVIFKDGTANYSAYFLIGAANSTNGVAPADINEVDSLSILQNTEQIRLHYRKSNTYDSAGPNLTYESGGGDDSQVIDLASGAAVLADWCAGSITGEGESMERREPTPGNGETAANWATSTETGANAGGRLAGTPGLTNTASSATETKITITNWRELY